MRLMWVTLAASGSESASTAKPSTPDTASKAPQTENKDVSSPTQERRVLRNEDGVIVGTTRRNEPKILGHIEVKPRRRKAVVKEGSRFIIDVLSAGVPLPISLHLHGRVKQLLICHHLSIMAQTQIWELMNRIFQMDVHCLEMQMMTELLMY